MAKTNDEHIDDTQVTSIRVAATSNRVEIVAEHRADLSVEGDAEITIDGTQATIGSVRSRLVIMVPEGADLIVGSTSGWVAVKGRVGRVAVATESGRIEIDEAESVDARTDSAQVRIESASDHCRIRTTSGRVSIGQCGGADVATGSGRITLRGVDGDVQAHCISGRIEVELEAARDVDAETVSGRVAISLPAGARAHKPADHSDKSDRPSNYDCTINARSVTGRVEVSSR